METLKNMTSILMGQAQAQMGNLQNVDAKELGEVIDMIKDLEEAIYYCTIVEAMEGKEKNGNGHAEKSMYYMPTPYYRDMDRSNGKMYYDGGMSSGGDSKSYREYEYFPYEMRDAREGRSPTSRKSYMESKEMHHDKSKQMKELENYMQELTTDIVEMIKDASPEEKQILQKKLQTLSTKVE